MSFNSRAKKTKFGSQITLVFLLVSLLFFANIKYKQYKIEKAIEAEKQSLINQSLLLSKKNKDLEDSITYLSSKNFKDKIAREQLNLKKEGELVYSFTETTGLNNSIDENLTVKRSNFEKWLNYFFKNNETQ